MLKRMLILSVLCAGLVACGAFQSSMRLEDMTPAERSARYAGAFAAFCAIEGADKADFRKVDFTKIELKKLKRSNRRAVAYAFNGDGGEFIIVTLEKNLCGVMANTEDAELVARAMVIGVLRSGGEARMGDGQEGGKVVAIRAGKDVAYVAQAELIDAPAEAGGGKLTLVRMIRAPKS